MPPIIILIKINYYTQYTIYNNIILYVTRKLCLIFTHTEVKIYINTTT